MKKIFFILLLCPSVLIAQKGAVKSDATQSGGYNVSKIGATPAPSPVKFENDTLYTTSGYKMYKGLVLHVGRGTARNGSFRFLKHGTGYGDSSLTNTSILIEEISDFRTSTVGNFYIFIKGPVTYPNGSSKEITINLSFDKALEDRPGLPSELILPDEFKNEKK
jgi:hypothetical protein